jgi:hypothetical protein
MAIMSDVHCEYCILMPFMNCRPVDPFEFALNPTKTIPMPADRFDIHQGDRRSPIPLTPSWPQRPESNGNSFSPIMRPPCKNQFWSAYLWRKRIMAGT